MLSIEMDLSMETGFEIFATNASGLMSSFANRSSIFEKLFLTREESSFVESSVS
jgi:hypothetical protein